MSDACLALFYVTGAQALRLCVASSAAALNSEQKALLDFLVLAKGKFFVGFGSSTFSFYLREYRVLADMVCAWSPGRFERTPCEGLEHTSKRKSWDCASVDAFIMQVRSTQ